MKTYFWRENGRGRHGGAEWFGASRPDKKVGPLDGPFGSTVILKTFYRAAKTESIGQVALKKIALKICRSTVVYVMAQNI